MITQLSIVLSDENRDINIHMEEDIKRQRIQYSGEQMYPNVSNKIHLVDLKKCKINNFIFFFSLP